MRRSKGHGNSEQGQALLEYALVLILVVAVAILALMLFGRTLREVYQAIVRVLQDPTKPFDLPSGTPRPVAKTINTVVKWAILGAGAAAIVYLLKELIPLIIGALQLIWQAGSYLVSAFIRLVSMSAKALAIAGTKIRSYAVPTLLKGCKTVWIWSNLASANLALALRQADVALTIFQRVKRIPITSLQAQLSLFSGTAIACIRARGDTITNLQQASTNYVRAREAVTQMPDGAERRKGSERLDEVGQGIGRILRQQRRQNAWGMATIEDCQEDETLYLNETYTLTTGIGWGDIPAELRTVPTARFLLPEPIPVEPLQFDIAVWAEDMDVRPSWVGTLELDRSLKPPCLTQFRLIPRARGQKTIRVDFYYQRHWLQQIELEVKVVKSPSAPLKVGMVLGVGGLGDRSFNDSAYRGLLLAQGLHDIEFEIADSGTLEATVALLRQWSETDCDLIIALGYHNRSAIAQVAEAFPENHFVVVDAEVSGKNIWSAVFREYEGDYVAGVLAAWVTRENRIGFIGGVPNPIVQRIESAFWRGAKSANPDIVVIPVYANRFDDECIGLSLAEVLYTVHGVDVIYQAAGRSGIGAIQAAQRLEKLIISTGGDHSDLAPEAVLTSRIKHVYRPVLDVVGAVREDRFEGGKTKSYGVTDGGISLVSLRPEVADRLPPGMDVDDLNARVNEILAAVTSGQITVDLDEVEAAISSSPDSNGSSHPV